MTVTGQALASRNLDSGSISLTLMKLRTFIALFAVMLFFSLFAPNFLSMMNAEVLRGALALYDWTDDELNRRRLAGIVHVSEELLEEVSGGSVERGVLIEVTLDSHAFAGAGDVMLFGELLHRFLGLYAEINLFTRLAIVSLPSQERIEWPRSKAERSPL